MKIHYIFAVLLILTCAAHIVEADDVTTNLGTIDYEETTEIDVEGDGMTNLRYITSDFDKKTLSYSITNYNNNTTTYEFTSNTVNIFPYTFEAGVKNYYFHDEKAGNVYKISIDFSEVEVPNNPYVQQIATLQEANDNKTQRILDMQEEIAAIELDLVNEKNKTQQTQQEVVNLSGQLSNLQQEYDQLLEDRNNLQDELESWPYTAVVIVLVSSVLIYVFVFLSMKKRFQKKSDITVENSTSYTPLMRKFDAFAKKFFRKEANKSKKGKEVSLDRINTEYAVDEPTAVEPALAQQQAPSRQPLKIGKQQQPPWETTKQSVDRDDPTQQIVNSFKDELFTKIDELNKRVDRAESKKRGSDQ